MELNYVHLVVLDRPDINHRHVLKVCNSYKEAAEWALSYFEFSPEHVNTVKIECKLKAENGDLI